MSDGAHRVLRPWTAAARAPSTSAPRRRLDVAAPRLSSVLPLDGGEKSGDLDLRPDVFHRSSSIHRHRLDVVAFLLFEVLPLEGGKKSGDPDLCPGVLQHSSFVNGLRPDVLQPSFSVHRRWPDFVAPLLPTVLTSDAVEKAADLTPVHFSQLVTPRSPSV